MVLSALRGMFALLVEISLGSIERKISIALVTLGGKVIVTLQT
jgi:hypothetical protein